MVIFESIAYLVKALACHAKDSGFNSRCSRYTFFKKISKISIYFEFGCIAQW